MNIRLSHHCNLVLALPDLENLLLFNFHAILFL